MELLRQGDYDAILLAGRYSLLGLPQRRAAVHRNGSLS